MPDRNAILDLVTIWSTFLRFSEPNDESELLLADILLDFGLVMIGVLQVRQSVVRGESALQQNIAVQETLSVDSRNRPCGGQVRELRRHDFLVAGA